MMECFGNKQYKKAMEIADTIDWRRVKNVSMLNTVSEIYEQTGEFQKSRDVLFMAFDKAPGSRKIVYRLGTLALKIGDFSEASDCYEEFVKLAPKDPNQYILKYKIQKAQKTPIQEQIRTLEDFKKAEYIEKWAYELAKLYHDAGMTAKCIEECDDLILWFSEGKYVYQAMELKMRYKPLTPLQQEKYEERHGVGEEKEAKEKEAQKKMNAMAEVLRAAGASREEKAEAPESLDEALEQLSAGETAGEETAAEATKVIGGSGIQAALAGGTPEPFMPKSEEKTMAERDDELKKNGQLRIDEILMKWEEKQKEHAKAIEIQKAKDEERLRKEREEAQKRKEEERRLMEQRLAESARRAAEEAAAKAAEEERLKEEERKAEASRREAEQYALEEAETKDVSDDLEELIERLEGSDKSQVPVEEEPFSEEEGEEPDFEETEVPEEESETEEPVEESREEVLFEEEMEPEASLEEEEGLEEALTEEEETEEFPEALSEEEAESEEWEEDLETASEENLDEEFDEDDFDEEEIFDQDEEMPEEAEMIHAPMEEAEAEDDFDEEDGDDFLDTEESEEEIEEFLDEEEDESEADFEEAELAETDFDEDDFEEEPLEPEEEEELEIEEPSEEEIQDRIRKSKGGVPFDTGFVVTGRYDLSATSEIGLKAGLTEEQKKLFSYFVPVRGMSEQIVEVLDNDRRAQREGTSKTGNLLVIGRKGSGKTVLAVDIVKAIQKQRNLKQGKVAIVTGESLNKKELTNIIQKLRGGAIIVEKAGKLNSRTIKELSYLMEKKTGELLFVLEDQRKPLERLLTAHPEFKKKFTSKLELPVFINDELVTFGQTYAKENGYKLDEMGILALYSRIDVMQREDHAVTVAEVKEIMDEAIEHSQKANVKHLARRVFGKGTDDSSRIILKEEDFRV
ncbi:tetratricopeptide repeat protein [Suipraeoptans intestinalis]|uniref:tetratricopeptide repeat protein n=1 Tax=Suipraeoptans intestinalis TaxID=2606628 RepID=UPI0023F1A175|nr:hypothetical protein [Suipraeoptans intestinalis]MDD7771113.1 hypothetical protein [Suipraeoptans intestinalis]MDY3121142.1 hypothetical protein [Suipraeoptans intestinalis]